MIEVELRKWLRKISNDQIKNTKNDVAKEVDSNYTNLNEYTFLSIIEKKLGDMAKDSKLQLMNNKITEAINNNLKIAGNELAISLKGLKILNLVKTNYLEINTTFIMDDVYNNVLQREIVNTIEESQESIKSRIRELIQGCRYENGGYSRGCLKELFLHRLQHFLEDLLDDVNHVCTYTLSYIQQKCVSTIEHRYNECMDLIEKTLWEMPKKKLCDLLKGSELGIYVQE